MRQFADLAASGVSIGIEQARASAPQLDRQKMIAVIPVRGVLEARTSLMGQMFGMSSYEQIGKTFDAMIKDSSVTGIVLDVASPGGMVYGAQELADKIFSARGTKPIIAVANPLAASGAYWIAAAADRVVMTPSGDVGSVGVIAEHVDMSSAIDKSGGKVTVIRSKNSPYKSEGNESEPLSEEARANMQARADSIYNRFVSDLARFRGVSVEHVNENYGKGRIVDAKTAMAAGMIDRVGTLSEITQKLVENRIRINNNEKALDDWSAMTPIECRKNKIAAIHVEACR